MKKKSLPFFTDWLCAGKLLSALSPFITQVKRCFTLNLFLALILGTARGESLGLF